MTVCILSSRKRRAYGVVRGPRRGGVGSIRSYPSRETEKRGKAKRELSAAASSLPRLLVTAPLIVSHATPRERTRDSPAVNHHHGISPFWSEPRSPTNDFGGSGRLNVERGQR